MLFLIWKIAFYFHKMIKYGAKFSAENLLKIIDLLSKITKTNSTFRKSKEKASQIYQIKIK